MLKLSKKAFKTHKENVIRLVGKEQAQRLFNAIRKDIPIIVFESNTLNPIDGELYRSLKMLGAKNVYNYDLMIEKEEKIFDVFCAVINVISCKSSETPKMLGMSGQY